MTAMLVRGLRGSVPVLPGVLTATWLWVVTLSATYLGRDAGAFAYIGSRVLNGALPLRDLWDHKPPGVYYVDALAFRLGGPEMAALLGLDLVFTLGLIVAMGWALSRVASPWTIALTLPWLAISMRAFLEGSTNFTELFAVVPMAIAMGCGLAALDPNGRRLCLWALGCGLAAGVAALFKPVAVSPAIALFVGLVPMFWSNRRAAIRLGMVAFVGLCAPIVAVASVYAMAGALPNLWDTVIVYNRLYAPHPSLGLLAQAGTALIGQPLFIPIPLLLLFGWRGVWRKPLPLLAFVLAAPAADIAGLIVQGRFYVHDMALLLPSLTMLSALALEGAVRLSGDVTLRLARVAVVGFAAAIVALSLPLLLWLQPAPGSQFVPSQSAISRWIASTCPETATIYVWGAEAQIYFLAQRRAASRYIYLYPLQMPGYDNDRRVATLLTDLKASRPCAIVDTAPWNDLIPPLSGSARLSWRPSSKFDGAYSYAGFQSIYAYVDANYSEAATVGGTPIFLRH